MPRTPFPRDAPAQMKAGSSNTRPGRRETDVTNDFEVAEFQGSLQTATAAEGLPVAFAISRSTCVTVLYAPRGADGQQPHDQDEVYVVARGQATLTVGHVSRILRQGDAAFVAARSDHRFSDISADFAAWAIFPLPHQTI